MGCGRNLYILYTPDESDPLVSFVFREKWTITGYNGRKYKGKNKNETNKMIEKYR